MNELGPLQQAAKEIGITSYEKLPKKLRNDAIEYAPSRIAELLVSIGYSSQIDMVKAYEVWHVYNRLS